MSKWVANRLKTDWLMTSDANPKLKKCLQEFEVLTELVDKQKSIPIIEVLLLITEKLFKESDETEQEFVCLRDWFTVLDEAVYKNWPKYEQMFLRWFAKSQSERKFSAVRPQFSTFNLDCRGIHKWEPVVLTSTLMVKLTTVISH